MADQMDTCEVYTMYAWRMFDMDLMVENRDVKHDHINHNLGVKIINVHMPANCLDCRLPSCGPWPVSTVATPDPYRHRDT